MKSPYPLQNVIYVDVDNTLISESGNPNTKLITKLSQLKEDGATLVLWSARGKEYADKIAEQLGIKDLFSFVLSKPGYIIDDMRWDWVKFTKVLSLNGEPEDRNNFQFKIPFWLSK